MRGLSLTRAGRAAEGLDDLRMARKLAPADPLSHLHYGIGLQETGRHARAAIGMGSLPRGVAVEVDATFEIQ